VELFCDTGNLKVFCRMVQPNVNVRCIDMSCLTDRVDMKSLTNLIMMDASKASQTIPNMDAKFYFLPYKFCDDGTASDRAHFFLHAVCAGWCHAQKSTGTFLCLSDDQRGYCGVYGSFQDKR
jgi:hypothetical protein